MVRPGPLDLANVQMSLHKKALLIGGKFPLELLGCLTTGCLLDDA